MNGIELGVVSVGIGINFLLAVIFATAVRHGSAYGYTDGWTAALVIFGTGFTLAVNQGFLYVPNDWLLDGILEFAGFAASGTPMAVEYFTRIQGQRIKENKLNGGGGNV